MFPIHCKRYHCTKHAVVCSERNFVSARIRVYPHRQTSLIRPELYGHFIEHLGSCIEDGIWVGDPSPIPNFGGIRSDVLDALRQLHPPILRWPGGCYADDYHWEDGVGPRPSRPRRVNIWWGQNVEDPMVISAPMSTFGCVGHWSAEPYGPCCRKCGERKPPRTTRDWVEYCNFAGDSRPLPTPGPRMDPPHLSAFDTGALETKHGDAAGTSAPMITLSNSSDSQPTSASTAAPAPSQSLVVPTETIISGPVDSSRNLAALR